MSERDEHFNPYAALGVRPDASEKEIKSAYRRLAFQHHPDRNKNDPEAARLLREVISAHEILSDADKRSAYDRNRPGPRNDGGMRPEDYEQAFSGDLSPDKKPPNDVLLTTTIDFAASVAGTDCSLAYKRFAQCEACQGTGAISGAVQTCTDCKGVGKRRVGLTRMVHCATCGGKGVHIEDPCRACHGEGRFDQQESRTVSIPAGIRNGERVRVANAGSAGTRGAACGDLVVRVEVQPHPYFHRRGDDVLIQVPISYAQAVLGARLSVPGPMGDTEVTVPSGTPSGRELRAQGLGFRRANEVVGDLVVQVYIHVPEATDPTEGDLLRQLEAFSDAKTVAHPFLKDHWKK